MNEERHDTRIAQRLMRQIQNPAEKAKVQVLLGILFELRSICEKIDELCTVIYHSRDIEKPNTGG